MLRIVGNSWNNIEGLFFHHKSVDIKGCGHDKYNTHNIRGMVWSPRFQGADTIFIRGCEENFMFYWLKPHVFPIVKKIFVMETHPCEYQVLHRFNKNTKIYLDEKYYNRFHGKWWTQRQNPYIRPVSIDHIVSQLQKNEKKGIYEIDLFNENK